MTRKIKIEPVYNDDVDDEVEIKNEVEEAIQEEVIEVEKEEIEKEEEIEPKEINTNKTKGIDMPITKKTIDQVQCNLCSKYMSSKK